MLGGENNSKSILIVEDEAITALNLKLDLEDLGNLSINFSFENDLENKISFNLEKTYDECLFNYFDNGFGIKEVISESSSRTIFVNQLIKQIEGTVQSHETFISIRFKL